MKGKTPSKKKRIGFWKAYEKADLKDYRKVWDLVRDIVLEEGVPFEAKRLGRRPKLELWMYIAIAVIYAYFGDTFRETEFRLPDLCGKKLDHSNLVR